MTIDLGFGWLTLPGGREVGIVDVPGHRDFVENMLAGVAGIDAVWMVVAAEEGVMPQTREHLAIIDLLEIGGGVLVLTKTDLVSDPDWLDAVESDMRAAARGTALWDAPIIRVSARTGQGLPDLLSATAALLDRLPVKPNLSRPRLALDRVFSMEGYGTVVTGTLTDGELEVGDEIEFLPSGLSGRVRGLQNHRRQVVRALPGARTAVNVAGIPAGALKRGDVLIHPAQYAATRRIDARIRLLPDASTNLPHNSQTKVFIGTSETMARVRLLGIDHLQRGEEGWIQLELQDPVVCARGDAFVLRMPSPPETIGGGRIVEPHPEGRHKRHDDSVLRTLEALMSGTPAEILLEAASALGPASARDIVQRSRLPEDAAATALAETLATSRLVSLEPGAITVDSQALVTSAQDLESISKRTSQALADFHAKFPLRQGMPREELRNQVGLEARPFQAILAHMETHGGVSSRGSVVALSGHATRLTPSQQAAADSLMQRFDANPNAPPSVKECIDAVGADVFGALREQGILVPVSADVVFSNSSYENMVRAIRAELEQRKEITLANVRDLFGTSRRYAQALLEHLDDTGITHRIGDVRVLAPGSPERQL
jgi:selenocysteine-specific elongation factor